MRCETARAALDGALSVYDEAALDAHLAGCPACAAAVDAPVAPPIRLPPVVTPPTLRAATLAAVQREMRPARRWPPLAAGFALAAGLALMLLPGEPPPPTLIERGVGVAIPEVGLKIAVSTGGGLARLKPGAAYAPGDTLYFRAAVPGPTPAALLRHGAAGTEVIGRFTLPAGETDLGAAASALAWRLETGEGSSVFALVASPQLPDDEALSRLAGPGLCESALAAGLGCAEAPVTVSP